jgi:hypothetical protein
VSSLPDQADEKLPVLLVDGYNVIMARLQAEGRILRNELDDGSARFGSAAAAAACAAGQLPVSFQEERERLIDDTRDYALSLNCRGVVVFDALGNRDPNAVARCGGGPSMQGFHVALLLGRTRGSWGESTPHAITVKCMSGCKPADARGDRCGVLFMNLAQHLCSARVACVCCGLPLRA